jgi:hypothetical protein
MSAKEPRRNKFIPKGDTATVVSAFVVVSGVILMAFEYPTSQIILGAGLGFLFRGVAKTK